MARAADCCARSPASITAASSTPRASIRASESRSPSSASMRVVASRMRPTKRAASSGSSSAPSASTSALARIAATGFFSSCERSAANVSTNGRPSSWRRIESIAFERLCTSRPCAGGGTARRSPSLTRTANSVSTSSGCAIDRPRKSAESAAVTPRTMLTTRMKGAMSSSARRITMVCFTTRTEPTVCPRTMIGAVPKTVLGALGERPPENTTPPAGSSKASPRSAGSGRPECAAAYLRPTSSRPAPRTSISLPTNAAIACASSAAAPSVISVVRASSRSSTSSPRPSANAPTVLASARKNCIRMLVPCERARIRREAMKATKKISAMALPLVMKTRITPSRCRLHAPSGGPSPGSPPRAPSRSAPRRRRPPRPSCAGLSRANPRCDR